MPYRNKIREFLESHELTAYAMIKATAISPTTGYAMARDEWYIPATATLEVISDAYGVGVGDLLEWVPPSEVLFTTSEAFEEAQARGYTKAMRTFNRDLNGDRHELEALGLRVSAEGLAQREANPSNNSLRWIYFV